MTWQYHFSYNCFRTVLFVQIQRGGAKLLAKEGEKSSPKEQFMRGYTAPYARTFAPSPLYLYEKYLYEKYLYEKSVRKIIVRKVPYKNNCTKSDTAIIMRYLL